MFLLLEPLLPGCCHCLIDSLLVVVIFGLLQVQFESFCLFERGGHEQLILDFEVTGRSELHAEDVDFFVEVVVLVFEHGDFVLVEGHLVAGELHRSVIILYCNQQVFKGSSSSEYAVGLTHWIGSPLVDVKEEQAYQPQVVEYCVDALVTAKLPMQPNYVEQQHQQQGQQEHK